MCRKVHGYHVRHAGSVGDAFSRKAVSHSAAPVADLAQHGNAYAASVPYVASLHYEADHKLL